MNGVLLTITADIKTPRGVHIISHYLVAIAPSLPLLVFAQTADASSREMLLRWNPGGYMATLSEPDSGNYPGSQTRIRNWNFGARSTPTSSLTLSPSDFHRNCAPRGLSGTRTMRPGSEPPLSTCQLVPSTFRTFPSHLAPALPVSFVVSG